MRKTVAAFSQLPEWLLHAIAERHELLKLDPRKGDIAGQLADILPRADGLIGAGRRLGAEQLQGAQKLKIVSSVSVGYDNYDVDYLTGRGILLTNTPDVLTETTADLAFTLLASTARRIPELDAYVKAGRWSSTIGANQFGSDIHGKTLGIVGAGRIGMAIARRGHFGFHMNVLYHSRHRKPELEQEVSARHRTLDTLLEEADFVCLVVPLSAETRHMIGRRELALMKRSGILINIARGPVVDEAALIEALREGIIQAAGLDVYEKEPLTASPLFAMANVVTLPHIGSATHETRKAMAERALQNLLAGLAGERPQDLVNPQAWRV
jgi:gluconate 2-dehydrogenase